MKQENPLFYLFKKLSWPVGLIIIAVLISSLGSITGLLVPFFTGKLVDKFSFENMNWILSLDSFLFLSMLYSGIGPYLLAKSVKIIYAIRSVLGNI